STTWLRMAPRSPAFSWRRSKSRYGWGSTKRVGNKLCIQMPRQTAMTGRSRKVISLRYSILTVTEGPPQITTGIQPDWDNNPEEVTHPVVTTLPSLTVNPEEKRQALERVL